MRKFIPALIVALYLCFPAAAQTESNISSNSFQQWLQDVGQEAVQDGVSQATVDSALAETSYDAHVIDHDQAQPENTATFSSYSSHIISTDRVAGGRAMMRKYAKLLQAISKRYGVQPQVIVALWGVESNYGRNPGNYGTIDSLATLAYEGRRGAFFRHELISALHILDRGQMPVSELRGSWAGAMGQCQFIPSTYLRYAVAYDGKSAPDIWDNTADVFASIAHYIAAEGWKDDLTWGREVRLAHDVPEDDIGLDHPRMLAEWGKLGVRNVGGRALPAKPLKAALVQPDGLNGRSFLVYDNFRALMHWNRSTYFAASVGMLADKIKAGK